MVSLGKRDLLDVMAAASRSLPPEGTNVRQSIEQFGVFHPE